MTYPEPKLVYLNTVHNTATIELGSFNLDCALSPDDPTDLLVWLHEPRIYLIGTTLRVAGVFGVSAPRVKSFGEGLEQIMTLAGNFPNNKTKLYPERHYMFMRIKQAIHNHYCPYDEDV